MGPTEAGPENGCCMDWLEGVTVGGSVFASSEEEQTSVVVGLSLETA